MGAVRGCGCGHGGGGRWGVKGKGILGQSNGSDGQAYMSMSSSPSTI